MDKKNFFKNIGTILMFAVFGTLIASCLTAFGIYVVGLTNFIPVRKIAEIYKLIY